MSDEPLNQSEPHSEEISAQEQPQQSEEPQEDPVQPRSI
jgi:hypothetical protein